MSLVFHLAVATIHKLINLLLLQVLCPCPVILGQLCSSSQIRKRLPSASASRDVETHDWSLHLAALESDNSGKEGSFPCRFCTSVFRSNSGRSYHERLHTGRAFTCEECGRLFMSENKLRRHIDAVHNKTRHPCANCNKSFTQKENLVRHLKYSCSGSHSLDKSH